VPVVTGMSGTGQSTVLNLVAQRGYRTNQPLVIAGELVDEVCSTASRNSRRTWPDHPT
jgi:RNase adaptor protein for sRNA GlmZ degradation